MRTTMPASALTAAILAIGFAAYTCTAQDLTGTVVDDQRQPLPFASVSLPAVHRGAVTDDNGRFAVRKLPAGSYTVEISMIGYTKEIRAVTIGARDVELAVVLHQSALELPGVIVTGKPQPSDELHSSQSISEVDGRELERLRGQTVMQGLENLPGVTTYTTGAGIAKPVIRGMTSQRVLVVSDGTRQEGQQWGDEHGPEIDGFDVGRIEVLRGPGSVLYGSDALGGVVNVIPRDLPSAEGGAAALAGEAAFNGFSNNRHVAGALEFSGASGPVGYRGHVTARHAGDVSTPAGPLFNSGLDELDGGALAGAKGSWGAAALDYSRFRQTLQFHEDPASHPVATPYQRVQHDKIHMHTDIPLPGVRLEMDNGWQVNDRREFDSASAAGPAMRLRLRTFTTDLRAHHAPIGSLFGTLGVSVMSQVNETLAEEKLIPGFRMVDAAAFLYEEFEQGIFDFSAGARYDTRALSVDATPALDVAAQRRDFHALTGSFGVVCRASRALAVSANVGSGWRAPSAYELFVDGVHEGTAQFLVGTASLATEHATDVDLSLRYASAGVTAELTGYRNAVADYIHAAPTAGVDSASGFRIYRLNQADATISGVEFSLQAEITDGLILTAGADLTRGVNGATDSPLPLMPADRVRAGARYTIPSVAGVRNPYVSIGMTAVADQNRIDTYETRTGGYALFSAGAGGEILAGAQRLTFDLGIENMFDRAYRDHLNRLKDFSINPGRNVTLKVSLPFTIAR